ncbi:hypothetical protein TeGR_g7040 [Tetraparma gracilis]|uniref:JmjC domain-containing protein n=1 Tax=Tetraparma gracilis TaxID=2962635 RepID=A0ABQ6N3Q3_9STRA|nr:hypothetical protein TeGR_g7040 [Tetraparma gracilis]
MAAQPSPQTTYRWVCGAGDGDYALPDLPPLLPPPLNRKVSLDAVTGKIKTGNRSTLIDGLKAKLSCMPAASDRVCPRVGQETFGDGREYIAANGFRLPLVITPLPPSSPPSTCAFGLKVPPPSFKPRDLLHILHPSFPVSCINVKYQSTNASITTLQEWVDYMETPAGDRATVNNLISLEYSDTSLASLTEPPSIVRFLSAVDRSWPASRRADNSVCPKVDSYCLSSPAGAYCDFHADFGGSSVFYHVHEGRKQFLVLPPTADVLRAYEAWLCMENQCDVFFPSLVEPSLLALVTVDAGETLLLPSGYIHAVFTPQDSLVFGGNFLTTHCIENQLRVFSVEVRTHVLEEYRFPFFKQLQYFMAASLLQRARGEGEPLAEAEREGAPALTAALRAWGMGLAGAGEERELAYNSVEECAVYAARTCGYGETQVREFVDELELRVKGEWGGGGGKVRKAEAGGEWEGERKKTQT